MRSFDTIYRKTQDSAYRRLHEHPGGPTEGIRVNLSRTSREPIPRGSNGLLQTASVIKTHPTTTRPDWPPPIAEPASDAARAQSERTGFRRENSLNQGASVQMFD